MDIAKICSIAGYLLQLLAEGFLRFYMRVPVTFVECVRAIADHVRAQADGLAAILARPFFGTRQQTLADTLRTEAFIHHQAADFRALKTLEDFNWQFNHTINRKQIFELATGNYLREGKDILFIGPPGIGKTHLA